MWVGMGECWDGGCGDGGLEGYCRGSSCGWAASSLVARDLRGWLRYPRPSIQIIEGRHERFGYITLSSLARVSLLMQLKISNDLLSTRNQTVMPLLGLYKRCFGTLDNVLAYLTANLTATSELPKDMQVEVERYYGLFTTNYLVYFFKVGTW
jgi:hypothetical protein